MPIATKLSRKLQEVFGTEAADAMVDWMQDVEGSRAELRALNDLSFARFDSRLGERIAVLDAKLDRSVARLDASVARLDAKVDRIDAELNAKIDHLGAGLNAKIDHVAAELNAKIDGVAAELNAKIDGVAAELNAKVDRVEANLTGRMEVGFARMDATLAKQRAELFRWAAMFWIGSLVAMVTAMAALEHIAK